MSRYLVRAYTIERGLDFRLLMEGVEFEEISNVFAGFLPLSLETVLRKQFICCLQG